MATNTNVARGLIPYAHYDGSVWNGSANIYFVAAAYTATSLFIGDPVTIHSASNDANGMPADNVGGTGSPLSGVMDGIVDGGPFAATPITVTRDRWNLPQLGTNQVYPGRGRSHAALLGAGRCLVQHHVCAITLVGQERKLCFRFGKHHYGLLGLSARGVRRGDFLSTLDLKIIRALNSADNLVVQPPTPT